MRRRPIAALAFLGVVAGIPSQHPLAADPLSDPYPETIDTHYEPIHATSETIMSALSASSKHGTFVHLLQRSKLVPMLSRLNGTVFAPTDDAWKAWDDEHRPQEEDVLANGWLGTAGLDEWLVDDEVAEAALERRIAMASSEEGARIHAEADNQNWALRQHLLYHILNYTLTERDWAPRQDNNVTIETTLLFPAGAAPTPSPIPEPGTPWTPSHGHGLLGDHGQRLRLALPGSAEGGERGLVGFDHFGDGGAPVWDGVGWKGAPNNTHLTDTDKDKGGREKDKTGVRWVRNGAVVGLERVLAPPASLLDTLRTTPQLAYLAQLLDVPQDTPEPLPPSLNRAPHVTLFAPSADAFTKAFDDIERGYLEGAFGVEGLSRVLAPGTLLTLDRKNPVGWSDAWPKKGANLTSAGDFLTISVNNGSVSVNGTTADIVDIFTENGVIHVMPSVVLPKGFRLLNSAEKVLLSRNATRFVSLMRSANLSTRYIGEPGHRDKAKRDFTILAPTDDAIDYMGYLDSQGVLPFGISSTLPSSFYGTTLPKRPQPPVDETSPLAALLKYHILEGSHPPDSIKDGQMLISELKTTALGGGRQRVHVSVSERRDDGSRRVEEGEITFGGAMVVGQPLQVGGDTIYFMSSLLSPPLDTLQTAVENLQLSTYIAAVYAAGLERMVKQNPATTFFIPRNQAFKNLGLAMKYLLLPEGRDELRKVIRYHAVEELLYTPDFEDGSFVLKTMEGGSIVLESNEGNLTLRSPSKWDGHDSGARLPANGDLRPAVIKERNELTETGVIHLIDSVVLPADLSVTIGKLARGSAQRTMSELMAKAGFAWILEGREPTREELEHVNLPAELIEASNGKDERGKDGKKHKDGKDGDDEDPLDLAFPAYTVLIPTDKAFSRINMTYYLSEPEALLRLLKLHIIPSSLGSVSANDHAPKRQPADNTPLSLEDDVVYPTLLSYDPQWRYSELAFRAWDDAGFLVGVRNARAGSTDRPAKTEAGGRASVRWRSSSKLAKDKRKPVVGDDLWRGGMTLGGGAIVIDTVLEPYDPGWFSRWGWIVLTVLGATAVLALAGVSVWWWWATVKRKQEGYERVAAEEEDARQEEENRQWRRFSRSSRVSHGHSHNNGNGNRSNGQSGEGRANGNGEVAQEEE